MGKRDRIRLADYEEKRYNELHKIVLGDDGKSRLNKIEYVIP